MNTRPSDATFHRFNKLKKKTNYFKQENETWQIWNNSWEPYTNSTVGLESIDKQLKEFTKQRQLSGDVLRQRNKMIPDRQAVKYDPVVPTLQEEVMDLIPSPVLRALVAHYKTADMVEIEINVKTSHTIKG